MSKRTTIIGIIAIIVLVLIGVGIYTRVQPTKPQALTTVKFGYIPIVDAAALYVAIDEGMFKAQGIDASITSISSGSAILEALSTGSLDVGLSNTLSFVLARAAGIDLVSIGGAQVDDQQHKEGAILSRADSTINSVSDLRGKTIAINASKNIVDLSIRKLLRKNGISPDDVRFVEIPFPQMESVLKSGQVDAIAVAEPFWTFAVNHGGVRVIGYYYGDVYNQLELGSWFATQKWVTANPATARKVYDAFVNAVKFLNDPQNDKTVRGIIANYTKTDLATASQMGLPTFETQLTQAGVQKIMDDMVSEGFLDKPITLDNIFYK
jgi:NitT/TauT family transport system substrate-binding protein